MLTRERAIVRVSRQRILFGLTKDQNGSARASKIEDFTSNFKKLFMITFSPTHVLITSSVQNSKCHAPLNKYCRHKSMFCSYIGIMK